MKNLILGQPSGESQESFQKWLNSRVQDRGLEANPALQSAAQAVATFD